MHKIKIKNIVAKQTSSIKEVMRIIDQSGLRSAYIIDEKNKLIGVISDSEIRRAILRGSDINKSVENIVNTNPVILMEKDETNLLVVKRTFKRLRKKMPDATHLLVINAQGCPKKLISSQNLIARPQIKRKTISKNHKNVLVVGGAGYLGSILVRKLLSRGYRVRVLDILMFGPGSVEDLMAHRSFELIHDDMRNISSLARALVGVDAVINLAAVVGDPACKNRPEDTIETNYLANKVLAEACKYHQINRYLYASTCSVYGTMDGEEELNEKAPLNPVSLYARSKIQSEEGILALIDENFAPTIMRMSTLYGYSPRMRFDLVVNAMTKSAIIDRKISVHGGGQQWRPLLHVADAAESYIRCLESPIDLVKGEIFNVGSNKQNYQILRIGKVVKKCIPNASLVIDGEMTDPRNYFVSFAKIRENLKFKVTNNLGNAILRIKKAIVNREIRNPEDLKYYNVEYNQ